MAEQETHIPRILRAFEGQVWALQPEKLQQIAEVIAAKAATGQIPTAGEVHAASKKQRGAMLRSGATAVIPVFGTICQRLTLMDAISGGCSLEDFTDSFRAAVADAEVGRIVLRFDSPGGSVFGVEEAGLVIAAGSKEKPVVAVLDPQAGSAAYWLASQADEIVVTHSGQGGSIGCFSVHFDFSEKLEEDGIRVTVIRGGANKAEGNPYEALSDEALAHLQSLVDFYDAAFTAAVARGRGVSIETVRESFGQGRMFEADRLVRLGMADRIATFDEVLSSKAEKSRSVVALSTPEHLAALAASATEHPAPIEALVTQATARLNELALAHIRAAAGQTASESHLAPTQPAPEAKGDTVEKNTAAQENGAGTDVLALERARLKNIRAIGQEHGIEQATIDQWIDAGLSVDEVNAEVLKQLRERAKATPNVRGAAVVKHRADDDPRRGFANHRDFLLAVMKNGGRTNREQVKDERLRPLAVLDDGDMEAGGDLAFLLPTAFSPAGIRAAAGSDEQGGYADRYGGFAVPTTTLPGMLQLGAEADPTAGRTQPLPMATPGVDIVARTDKNHATSVSGGFTVTRKPEAVAATSSRTEIEKVSLKATSLFGLAFATEEILTDSAISFAAIIASGFESQFAFHMFNEKLRGGGGNEFLGVLNSPAKVEVAAEGGQSADTILALNCIKMRARCWGYGSAIWIANHDTYPQLIQAAVVVEGSVGGGLVLVYKASLEEDRPDMLLGRPIFYSEHASKLGDVGDLILVNWSQYLEGLYQPLMSAESIHTRFVNHERTFKFWLRNAGAPWWRSALTPHKSADTLSPIVTLAAR